MPATDRIPARPPETVTENTRRANNALPVDAVPVPAPAPAPAPESASAAAATTESGAEIVTEITPGTVPEAATAVTTKSAIAKGTEADTTPVSGAEPTAQ